MPLDCGVKWREKLLHWGFSAGIWFKGIDGVLELIGGILLLASNPAALNHLIVTLTEHELQNDPGDLFCNLLRHAGNHLQSGAKFWGGLYLLTHGGIKVFLSAGILLNKLWAYPTAIAVIGGFILFQSGRLIVHFSFSLLIATAIDLIIVFLVWHEYRYVKRLRR